MSLCVLVCTDISKVQDDEVGDGTMLVVVLAGKHLREAEKFTEKNIHPITIIEGIGCISVKTFKFRSLYLTLCSMFTWKFSK